MLKRATVVFNNKALVSITQDLTQHAWQIDLVMSFVMFQGPLLEGKNKYDGTRDEDYLKVKGVHRKMEQHHCCFFLISSGGISVIA
jgi:hypothetical protein